MNLKNLTVAEQKQHVRLIQRGCLYLFMQRAFNIVSPGDVFVPAPYLEAMCFALEQALKGGSRRIIITVPPRSGKSIAASVVFPAWVLGHDPTKKIMVASYGAELAAKQARLFRSLTEHTAYKEIFPAYCPSSQRNAASEIETTRGGVRLAISVGGTATGLGADIIVIDDTMKAGDQHSEAKMEEVRRFYDETLYTRLNNKQEGIIIAIQQRLHEGDIVGHLLDKGGWTHLNFPAIAEEPATFPLYNGRTFSRNPGDILCPEREDAAALELIRSEMTARNFAAQYQQNPTALEEDIVQWRWFPRYGDPYAVDEYDYVVQSWDTATREGAKYAFSVGITLGLADDKWEMLDIFRRQLDFPDLLEAMKRSYHRWKPEQVIVEDASSGRQLLQYLVKDPDVPGRSVFRPYTPKHSKEVRLEMATPALKNGLIMLPREAPWIEPFKQELLGFPNRRDRDQVDALTQFVEWSQSRWGDAAKRWDRQTRTFRRPSR